VDSGSSLNELVAEDRDFRTHWIWDRRLPTGDEVDGEGNCRVCELCHPETSEEWKRCRNVGEDKMIEERHDGYEFVSHQNHGNVSKTPPNQ